MKSILYGTLAFLSGYILVSCSPGQRDLSTTSRCANLASSNCSSLNRSLEKRCVYSNETDSPVCMANALAVFGRSRNFCLIYKIKWAQSMNRSEHVAMFYGNQYVASLIHSGKFCQKHVVKGYLFDKFTRLLKNISKSGFDWNSPIQVSFDGELLDGDYRLASCIALGRDVAVKVVNVSENHPCTYQEFGRSKLSIAVADWGALEYVKLNRNAYVVNIFPVLPRSFDVRVEEILNKHGFIYYKKSLLLKQNGCLNLGRVSYGDNHWFGKVWIGNVENDFAGLRAHVKRKMNNSESGDLRVYVFVCENMLLVKSVKKKIRALVNIGNYPVHINDFANEAVELAQTYFNRNSWKVINNRPFNVSMKVFDRLVKEFQSYLKVYNYSSDDFCALDSLSVFGTKKVNVLKIFHLGGKFAEPKSRLLSNKFVNNWLWPEMKDAIILDPRYHFYYRGVKFIVVELLNDFYPMKSDTLKY